MLSDDFQRGRLYSRRIDIHERFGGQQQGGISTPTNAPYIFLFTGDSGTQFGYEDGWIEDGVYRYVGEGQVGDMQFRSGNKAIRDHAQNGKELLLFKTLGKGCPVRFEGRFACASWEYGRAPDKEGNDRQIIAFHLISTDDEQLADEAHTSRFPSTTLDELRRRAYQAAKDTAAGKSRDARQTYYQRSEAVKDYVLARAAGVCESCEKPAPFNRRKNGEPYLEPHHTRRVSDAGPDHPGWVAAVCPNCHKAIHFGEAGQSKNDALIERLKILEPPE